MQAQTSLFSLTGLPSEFGYLALVFTFVLALAPYFAAADFGVFKIPPLAPRVSSALRVLGPIAFLFVVFLYLPLFPARASNDVPDMAGTWIRKTNPPDMMRMTLSQTGKELHADFSIAPDEPLPTVDQNASVRETLNGRYIASEGYFELSILERRPECTHTYYGKLYPQSADSFGLQLYATSGACPPLPGPGSMQMYRRLPSPLPTPPADNS